MKVLVLGGSGYIGSRLCTLLQGSRWADVVTASSGRHGASPDLQVDTCDPAGMEQALRGIDAVVNCVAGDARSIATGAQVLAAAAIAQGCMRIVHLSSMSVYGAQEGELAEQAGTGPSLGWYGRAKCEAERRIQGFADAGGTAIVLRPGCVWGPGSVLWVERIGEWLRAGRLGDLGAAGDGWSNLVHVDDVCRAVLAGLRLPLPARSVRGFNLAGPDSPRWNEFFVDLGMAIGATPVRRIPRAQIVLDAWLGGPPLQAARLVLGRLGGRPGSLPRPLTPGLVALWRRHLRLDCTAAARELRLAWTSYETSLRQSADWYLKAAPVSVPAAHRQQL
ncbi:MAG: UDP-galactose 4-epimerase [Ramlibacter sp.]|nr:UDP-galactose 4-epimerase [Ramlibacter sp.]